MIRTFFVKDLDQRFTDELVFEVSAESHLDALKVRLRWFVAAALEGTHEYEVTGLVTTRPPVNWRPPLPGEGPQGALRTFKFRVAPPAPVEVSVDTLDIRTVS